VASSGPISEVNCRSRGITGPVQRFLRWAWSQPRAGWATRSCWQQYCWQRFRCYLHSTCTVGWWI